MATHAHIRPSGVWFAGIPVLHGEFELLDAAQFDSISASGGAYAPAATIYVGGSGMQIKLVGASTLDSGAALDCLSGSFLNIQSGGYFQSLVGSQANFAGQVYISSGGNVDVFGRVTIRGGSADPNAGFFTEAGSVAQFDGSLTVNGAAVFNAATNFNAGINVSGAASLFSSTVSFAGLTRLLGSTTFLGTLSLQAPMVASSAGRVVKRPPVAFSAVSASIHGYGPANADTAIVRTMTGSRVFYVDLGQDGDEFTVVNNSDQTLIVANGATTDAVTSLTNQVGGFRSVTLVQVSGAWEVLRKEKV